jgi:hypothetical protein
LCFARKAAQENWKIKWDLLDPSEILRKRNVQSAEQIMLPMIRSVSSKDIEIVLIEPKKDNVLQVMLKIRFSA